jgi:hypothetical protein
MRERPEREASKSVTVVAGGLATGLVMIKVIPGRSEYVYGGWMKKDAATAPDGSANGPQRLAQLLGKPVTSRQHHGV